MTPSIRTVLLVVLLLGCGSRDSANTNDTARVIMVFDVAGLGDKGFNDMGWAGVQRAVKELGVTASYLQSSEQGDYVPNLSLAAQQADVVVAMGFLMVESLAKVAPLHPETKFIFVDGEVTGDNIASFDFKAQEGAFLAGILAGMVTKTGRIGSVMGMDIPPVRAYEVGFRAGIRVASELETKEVTYHSATVGGFNDPSRGKALAQGLIGQGCDIVLQIAGNSGLGVIEAVKEIPEGVYAIGADMDQDDLAPGKVLASILKRIDVAVFEGIRGAKEGKFKSGHHWLGIDGGGMTLTDLLHSPVRLSSKVLGIVEEHEKKILGGMRVPSSEKTLEDFAISQ
jgi:basic membrane protein A and related proteins